jgi:hypothetical protein
VSGNSKTLSQEEQIAEQQRMAAPRVPAGSAVNHPGTVSLHLVAIGAAVDYLLDLRMFRSLGTGAIVDER